MLTTRRGRRPDQTSLDSMRLALASIRRSTDLNEVFQQVCVGAARVTTARHIVLAARHNGRVEVAASVGQIDRPRANLLLAELEGAGAFAGGGRSDGPMVAPLCADLIAGSLVAVDGRSEHFDAFELFAEAAGALIDLHLLRSRAAAAAHRVQPLEEVGSILGSVEPGDGLAIVAVDDLARLQAQSGSVGVDSAVQAAGAHLLNATRPPGDVVAAFRDGQFLVVLRDLKAPIENVAHRLVDTWRMTKPSTSISIGAAVHLPGQASLQTLERAETALVSALGVGGGSAHVSPR